MTEVIKKQIVSKPYLREDFLECYKVTYSVIDCKECPIYDSCTLRHDWEQKQEREQNG